MRLRVDFASALGLGEGYVKVVQNGVQPDSICPVETIVAGSRCSQGKAPDARIAWG